MLCDKHIDFFMPGPARCSILSELIEEGATATPVSRLAREQAIVRFARGLYQLPDAPIDAQHTLAEAAKLAPKGVIGMISALAFHELTDQMPAKVWIAIGPKDWHPKFRYPSTRFVHFPSDQRRVGAERHVIDGVAVPIFGDAKTIADLFRYRRTVGVSVALEGCAQHFEREKLRRRKSPSARATPAYGRPWSRT